MTWFTALTAWPAPIGPTWVIVRPIAVSTGRARSTSRSCPPTKIVRVAFWAPSLPPETGASTKTSPRPSSRSANFQLPDGAMVEQSMISVPSWAPAATPSGPKRTASTSGVSDTQTTTMSLAAATSAAVAANVAPRSASSGARPTVRFQTVSGKPARTMLAAIAEPIVPRPMKPIRSTPGPPRHRAPRRPDGRPPRVVPGAVCCTVHRFRLGSETREEEPLDGRGQPRGAGPHRQPARATPLADAAPSRRHHGCDPGRGRHDVRLQRAAHRLRHVRLLEQQGRPHRPLVLQSGSPTGRATSRCTPWASATAATWSRR